MSNLFKIGIFVTEMNNALNRRLTHVKVSRSKMVINFLEVLNDEGLIRYFTFIDQNKILVGLKYYNTKRLPSEIKIISKPSRRIYSRRNNIFLEILPGHKTSGFYIMTTPFGVTTSTDAILYKWYTGEVLLWVSY